RENVIVSPGGIASALVRSNFSPAFFIDLRERLRGLRLFIRGAGFGGTSLHHSSISCCLVPAYLLRSRLPSLSPGMPSHSPCSVYCQSHHCGHVAFGQLGLPDVYCASQSRYCDSSESRLSPSCSFSTWPEWMIGLLPVSRFTSRKKVFRSSSETPSSS